MKLATLWDGSPDGCLAVISDDHSRYLTASFHTLQQAIDHWDKAQPALLDCTRRLSAGEGESLDGRTLLAPLPRAWQWLDGSAFPTHGMLMQRAFNHDPIDTDLPLMYQGMSHQFIGPLEDVPFPSEADGIDFEGEYGVITSAVPMGISAEAALAHIKLIVQINDWSLRALAPREMKTGFGWVQAKPACSVAPVAVTPDELGTSWRDGRVCLPLRIELNGVRFGEAVGDEMAFGFHELIAHAARTRSLPAGTIIGSGTVSNADYGSAGSSCMSELRAIEMIESGGKPTTPFLHFGDRVRMEARKADGAPLFGAIDQQVVQG
jgi:fumarylacetoacetate (FAA) hydrolase